MLTTHLNATPLLKFILIEDTVEERGRKILDHLINSRTKTPEHRIHYFVFEGVFKRSKTKGVTYHDFTTDVRGWSKEKPCFKKAISQINPSIMIIDSLAHFVNEHGFKESYRLLNDLIRDANILQVISILHVDTLGDFKLSHYFEYLATLTMALEPKFNSARSRVSYAYKKSGGKVVKEIEEFYFDGDVLRTRPLKKLDVKDLVQESMREVPDTLTTFKISLDDRERQARDELVLPYLPKENSETGGQIFYQMDEVDDWDEEDPDDDLDI